MSSTSEALRNAVLERGLDWIVPDWPLPAGVGALMTTRHGGVSDGAFATMNLGDHVGDAGDRVLENRRRLRDVACAEPVWLEQVHSSQVVVDPVPGSRPKADGIVLHTPRMAAAILVADCLPVLLCDAEGSVVGAAHAGWRGLSGGVIENTVRAMQRPAGTLTAWLGAAIGPSSFEVGEDVRAAFCGEDADALPCFTYLCQGKWLADLYGLARLRLRRLGLTSIQGGGECTLRDAARFFSYRRDRVSGRMAALVWRG
jgi:YfiH family protein